MSVSRGQRPTLTVDVGAEQVRDCGQRRSTARTCTTSSTPCRCTTSASRAVLRRQRLCGSRRLNVTRARAIFRALRLSRGHRGEPHHSARNPGTLSHPSSQRDDGVGDCAGGPGSWDSLKRKGTSGRDPTAAPTGHAARVDDDVGLAGDKVDHSFAASILLAEALGRARMQVRMSILARQHARALER